MAASNASDNGTQMTLLTKEDMTVEKVAELYEDMTQSEIGAYFNTSQREVSAFMSENNMRTRTSSEAALIREQRMRERNGGSYTVSDSRNKAVQKAADSREVTSVDFATVGTECVLENREDGLYSITTYTTRIEGIPTEFVTTSEEKLLPERITL